MVGALYGLWEAIAFAEGQKVMSERSPGRRTQLRLLRNHVQRAAQRIRVARAKPNAGQVIAHALVAPCHDLTPWAYPVCAELAHAQL